MAEQNRLTFTLIMRRIFETTMSLLSKDDEAEATDYMIFEERRSMGSEGEAIDVDALQIESQIVAIYW